MGTMVFLLFKDIKKVCDIYHSSENGYQLI